MVRILRVVALLAFGYTLILLVTGGFQTEIAGLTIRSRNVERFVTIGVLAWVMAWWLQPSPDRFAGGLRPDEVVPPSVSPWRVVPIAVILAAVLALAVWQSPTLTRELPDETAFGDFALLELYTRDAAAGELLTGPYSRFRWNHPGPAMFYLFSPVYERSGEKLAGLRVAAWIFNGVVLLLIWFVLVRGGPVWFAAIVFAAITIYLIRVPDLLASPWNPHLTVVPMGLLIVASAAVASGLAALWPLVAIVASFVVQSHLSVAPAVVLLLVATGVLIVRHAPASDRRRHWRWIAVGGVAAFVMWLPPLLHELSSPTSNVAAIFRAFFLAPQSTAPMRDGLAAALTMLSAPVMPALDLAWGGKVINSVGVMPMLVAVGSLVAVRWTARRLAPAGRFAANVVWLSAWTSVAALWATSRIQGEVMDQLVFWITIVGTINLACLAAAALRGVADRATSVPNSHRWVSFVVILGAVLVLNLSDQALREASQTYAADSTNAPRVREESTALAAVLERDGLRRPLVYVTQESWSDAAGILLALRKRGLTPAVEPDWIFMFGPPSAATGQEDSEVVIAGLDGHRRLSQPGFTVVGEWSGVSIHIRRRP